MTNSGLMPIGSFAQRCGLTTSALRFYADAGLLTPAAVDPVSGYRFYAGEQVDRAILVRRLREVDVPLAVVQKVVDAPPDEAARLIDEHVSTVMEAAAMASRRAAAIKDALGVPRGAAAVEVNGPVTAAAIEQVLGATCAESDPAVLGGIRFESDSGTVVVTATNRYRLSTRTLPTTSESAPPWAITVRGDDLRACLADLRRTPRARIEVGDTGMWVRFPDRGVRHCRTLDDPFPDYRSMLADLAPVSTRIEMSKTALLTTLEHQPGDAICLRVNTTDVTVCCGPAGDRHGLPAVVTGSPVELWFEMTTLYPAVSTAIGNDMLIDLRGPRQPVTIRSADNGDLTTLAMPSLPPNTDEHATQKETNR
ncbi:MerR family transcriptional regulator [Gordonia terrae]|uniref:DNA polymerase III subunit beta family protein n=1 Tax=Gordonia terrae TaxID=2055 RepID=UPI003F6C967C